MRRWFIPVKAADARREFDAPYPLLRRVEIRLAEVVDNSLRSFVPDYTPLYPRFRAIMQSLEAAGFIQRGSLASRYLQHMPGSLYAAKFFAARTHAGEKRTIRGNGFSLETEDEALSKAFGEFLERIFLYQPRSSLRLASYATFVKERAACMPAMFSSFSPEQLNTFPRMRVDANAVFSWIKTTELLSSSESYIPAQTVFWGYRSDEPLLREANTNGSAGGFGEFEWMTAAIYELIERDGFFSYWLNGMPPPPIAFRGDEDPVLLSLVHSLRQQHVEAHFLDITTDLNVPSCACVLVDRAAVHAPLVSVGASAGFGGFSPLRKSLLEALQARNFRRSDLPALVPESYEPFRNRTITQETRLRYWRGKAAESQLALLLGGSSVPLAQTTFWKERHASTSIEEEHKRLLDRFRGRGEAYRIYAYQADDPLLTRIGYRVGKVVIPALVPLYLSEHHAPLASKRLSEVASYFGWKGTRPHTQPHPFI
jgi:thiazole/oxazole-forming peptide maturase SagD family component